MSEYVVPLKRSHGKPGHLSLDEKNALIQSIKTWFWSDRKRGSVKAILLKHKISRDTFNRYTRIYAKTESPDWTCWNCGKKDQCNLFQTHIKTREVELDKEFRCSLYEIVHKYTPKISKDPNICGGSARIEGTRMPIWTIILCDKSLMSDEIILKNYSHLTLSELELAREYYKQNKAEIDQEIEGNTEESGYQEEPE